MEGIYLNNENVGTKLLDFYDDGEVLGVSLSDKLRNINTVLRWFNRENLDGNFGRGVYKIENNKISFEITTKEGTILYDGGILENKDLLLNIHSLINGSKSSLIYTPYSHPKPQPNSIFMRIKEWVMAKPIVGWIILIPTVIVCTLVGNLAWYLLSLITFRFLQTDSLFYKTVYFSVSGIITSYIYLYVGIYLAPSKKKLIAILLFVLLLLTASLSLTQSILDKDTWMIVYSIFLVISGIISFINIDKD